MIDAPSPNHDERGVPVSMIVLHYTGMKTGRAALDRLRDPAAKVSAHYMVERDGTVYALVPEERRAWHAGIAEWQGRRDVNAMSVGVEIVNRGHEFGYQDFPEAQVAATCDIVRMVIKSHGVRAERVVGHSDVAPDRKEDPGERFPWTFLARKGLVLPPWDGSRVEPLPSTVEAVRLLTEIGYGVEAFGSDACVTAFQRRFASELLGAGLDESTRHAIAWVQKRASSSKP